MNDSRLTELRRPLTQRVAAAAPDLVTSGSFLWCWIAPAAWRKSLASELGVILLVEFFVMHGGPFIGGISHSDNTTTGARLRSALILGAAYGLLAAALAYSYFAVWWLPVFAFAWLIAERFISIMAGTGSNTLERMRQQYYWGRSALYYIAFAFLVIFIPMPKLGFSGVQGLTGPWPWTIPPEAVMAWGFFYFLALALTKLLEKDKWAQRAASLMKTESKPAAAADAKLPPN